MDELDQSSKPTVNTAQYHVDKRHLHYEFNCGTDKLASINRTAELNIDKADGAAIHRFRIKPGWNR